MSQNDLYQLLVDVWEFLDDQQDVTDGPDGEPAPNGAMRLAQRVDEALKELP